MPGTAQEFAAFNAAIRLRPGNTSEGIIAERARIGTAIQYLGRSPTGAEVSLLGRKATGGSVREVRENERRLKADLEKARQRIAAEVRSAYAFTNSQQLGPVGGSSAGGGGGFAAPIGSVGRLPGGTSSGQARSAGRLNPQAVSAVTAGAEGGGGIPPAGWIIAGIVLWWIWRQH